MKTEVEMIERAVLAAAVTDCLTGIECDTDMHAAGGIYMDDHAGQEEEESCVVDADHAS